MILSEMGLLCGVMKVMEKEAAGRSRVMEAIRAELLGMGLEDGRFDALYRRVAAGFGLGFCEMWVLYHLHAAGTGLTQHGLVCRMFQPKQTVNSAVAKLSREGLAVLRAAAGSRKEKVVRLTPAGRALAAKTVGRLLEAELRAAEAFGLRKVRALSRLRGEFLGLLEEACGKGLPGKAVGDGRDD